MSHIKYLAKLTLQKMQFPSNKSLLSVEFHVSDKQGQKY